jgi:polygalacturonase
MTSLLKSTTSLIITLSLSTIPCLGRIYNVRSAGAQGNNEANDGPAIQKAIDECFASGGGMAYVPAGDYRCGALRLRSNVSLFLEAGATLWVSPDKEDYPESNRFLYAEGQTNITIEGRGTIQGTGQADLMRKKTDKTEQRPAFRVGILRFMRCRNVSIKDITVRYSDSWTFDLEFCENVLITGRFRAGMYTSRIATLSPEMTALCARPGKGLPAKILW